MWYYNTNIKVYIYYIINIASQKQTNALIKNLFI